MVTGGYPIIWWPTNNHSLEYNTAITEMWWPTHKLAHAQLRWCTDHSGPSSGGACIKPPFLTGITIFAACTSQSTIMRTASLLQVGLLAIVALPRRTMQNSLTHSATRCPGSFSFRIPFVLTRATILPSKPAVKHRHYCYVLPGPVARGAALAVECAPHKFEEFAETHLSISI